MKGRHLGYVLPRMGNMLEVIENGCATRDDCVVLEVGCGYGRAMQQLKEQFPRVRVIGMNLKLYRKEIPGQEYIHGDCGKRIPLPDDSVDFIYSIATLHFVRNRARFFEECFRVLKPGGQLRVHQPRFHPEFWAWRNIDVVLDNGEESTLRDHLRTMRKHDIFFGADESFLIIKKHPGDEPLHLGLQFLPECCSEYGVLFGKRYQGYVRNVYQRCLPGTATQPH